jgi:hypothetical protein
LAQERENIVSGRGQAADKVGDSLRIGFSQRGDLGAVFGFSILVCEAKFSVSPSREDSHDRKEQKGNGSNGPGELEPAVSFFLPQDGHVRDSYIEQRSNDFD